MARSVTDYDEIAQLIEQLETTPEEQPTTIHSISSSIIQKFGSFARNDAFAASQDPVENKKMEWLVAQLDEFAGIIVNLISSENETIALTAFAVALKIALINGKYRRINVQPLIQEIATASLQAPCDVFLGWSEYLSSDDTRYYFLRCVPEIIDSENEVSRQCDRLLSVLGSLENLPQDNDQIVAFYFGRPKVSKSAIKSGKGNVLSLNSHRSAFQRAWLATLQLPLSLGQLKQVFTTMHATVIPNMSKPQVLMDFFTDAYNHGGPIALLALNGLFSLIQDYNLDYPNFYRKLYSLLGDGSLLVSSQRARFFRLLDLFLSSTHLPATIPASIMKRLARLSLYAPPGALVAVIPFIYNQMKRHPTCVLMIHRTTDVRGPDADPFDENETDPMKTRAIDSSLWEIQMMTEHYQPNVAAMAKILSQPMRKPSYQLEHFLSHSYETLYASQKHRKGDAPALEFEDVKLFDDAEGGIMTAWSL